MEITDRITWISIMVLLALTSYTVYHIFQFMPAADQCKPAFDIINECGCIPDKGIADIFGVEFKNYDLNISRGDDGN